VKAIGSDWRSLIVASTLLAALCLCPTQLLASPISNNITINSATVKAIHADDLAFAQPADLLEVEIDFTNTENVTGLSQACDLDDNPSVGATVFGQPYAFSLRVRPGSCQSGGGVSINFPPSSVITAKGKTFAVFRGTAVSGEPVDLRIDTLSGETRRICGRWLVTAVIGTVDLSSITANPVAVEITTDPVDDMDDLGCVEINAELD
jgi:hypothetical protein